MDNDSVAEFLERIAMLLELSGENPFKVRSYRNASTTVENLDEEIGAIVEEGRLTQLKGIGKGISEGIAEFMERGSSALLDELEAAVPEGLVEMTRIRGLGPSRVKTIHKKLGIASIGELEYACIENRLVELKGFGTKSQTAILNEIQLYKKYSRFFHMHYALDALEEVAGLLEEDEKVIEVSLSGQARRFFEVVGTGCLVVSSNDPDAVLDLLARFDHLFNEFEGSEGFFKATHVYGIPIKVHIVGPDHYPLRLLWTTGSKKHLEMLQDCATERKLTLNKNGLFELDSHVPMKFSDEREIYKALGIKPIPAELREGGDEVLAAAKNGLPKLVETSDIQGILHVHTRYSDGTETIEEIAEAAQAAGYAYLGISDHSRTASYAGGLSIPTLKKQGEEIKDLNKAMKGFRILHGIESDILTDGSLDYPDEVLDDLDFVIASVHSSLTLEKDAMTERIIKAVRHRATRILGHPSGRLLLGREPYELDMERVLEACAEEGVMVEINANPHRLDLDWRWLKECRRLGIRVAINPDAHRLDGLEDVRYGVGIARKGWLEKEHVANCLSAEELLRCWRR
ncbi:MAG: DNA polymerase/3'-5' exonuclease PolX [Planctomycetota bacterium]|jgi:DNA polymerase (family 10)